MPDNKRVHLAVIDCQGVVRFVAPLWPGADDEDAVYDEVVAAVEQQTVAHASRPRR